MQLLIKETNIKKLLILGAAVLAPLMIASGVYATKSNDNGKPETVYLCHKTSSEKNPWVVQQVDANEEQSHLAKGDFVYDGPLKDNGHPDQKAGDKWCNGHVPKDVCPNIDGFQAVVPDGKELKDNLCVDKTVPTEPNPPVETTPVTPVTPTTTPVTVDTSESFGK